MEEAYQNQFSIQQRNTCLPWTWFYAVYMQLSVFLPIALYFVSHYPKQAKGLYFIIIAALSISKGVMINNVYNDLQEHGVSTIGMTNPARNIMYYQDIYIKPFEHYISFIVFGATSGLIFHQYIVNIATLDDMQSDKK